MKSILINNMRVLLITDNHTPTGGAERYFFDLKTRLKNQPELEVYSLGFGPEETEGEDFLVLKSIQSNAAKLLWRTIFQPWIYVKLRQQIKKIRPDVIHLHNVKQYTPSVLLAIKDYPVVQTVHDFSCICPTAQNIHKNNQACPTGLRIACFWQHQVKYHPLVYLALLPSFYLLRNQLRKRVKQFIAPSLLLTDYLRNNHFEPAICIPPFIPEKKPYSFTQLHPHHFLFAGHLGAHKGVMILLEEFALACQKNSHLVLHIAGTGPEQATMQQRVVELGLENQVIFLGWQAQLDDWYEKCIGVIFPSVGMESFGLVMTESMSHARPIIAANRGTSLTLIDDDRTGLLFDLQKRGDLAEKILALAGNVALAKELGEKGYEKLYGLIDNEKLIREIVDVYRAVGS